MDYFQKCVFKTSHSHVTLGKLLHPWALSFFTWKKEIIGTTLQSVLRVQLSPSFQGELNASHYHHPNHHTTFRFSNLTFEKCSVLFSSGNLRTLTCGHEGQKSPSSILLILMCFLEKIRTIFSNSYELWTNKSQTLTINGLLGESCMP